METVDFVMADLRMRTDPTDARLMVSESSLVVGNMAFAVYFPDYSGPVIGTFPDRATAVAFCNRVNDVVREFGGEPMPVSDEP